MSKSSVTIPNKLYFRIGEVADLLAVKPYVLRYWETEFADIKPAKSKSGQRLYKRRDVEMLVRIKDLLYRDRFTINGARKKLKDMVREQRGPGPVTQMPLELPEERERFSIKGNGKNAAHSSASSRSGRSTPPLDSRKILLKLKRDLEAVLDFLKP